ncbi:MAG: hypothetical protein AB8Z16_01060 [Coxiella endosymbiont of Haemaphysalis qinghaiensis]
MIIIKWLEKESGAIFLKKLIKNAIFITLVFFTGLSVMTVCSRYAKKLNKKSLQFINIPNSLPMIASVYSVIEILGIE